VRLHKVFAFACPVLAAISLLAAADVLHQPDGNFKEQRPVLQPVHGGMARFGAQTIPVLQIPLLLEGVGPNKFVRKSAGTTRRTYPFALTRQQARVLAVYRANGLGVFLAPRGLRVESAVEGVDGGSEVTLTDGRGDWVVLRTDGACVGCIDESAFDWLPWVPTGFFASAVKPHSRHPLLVTKVRRGAAEMSYRIPGSMVTGATLYQLTGQALFFVQMFASLPRYPKTLETVMARFYIFENTKIGK